MALNPFATLDGALRYQRGRPFHHPQTLEKIFQLMGVTRVDRALDVACGTGLSTIALKDRADLATGVDATEAMVSIAADAANVSYAVAQAEKLPFKRQSFDLLTVASGVHWFQQSHFFRDAARVLDSEGWLVLYDHPFVGCIDEPAIDEWLLQEFEHRYPTPQHGGRPDEPMGHPPEFAELDDLVFDDHISLTHDEFVAYLLSNSNTIAAATEGRERPKETEAWLRAQTSQWFGSKEPRTFVFRGIVRCFRRSA